MEFRAQIVGRTTWDGKPAAILDRTYFYPTGGGQPHDAGTLNQVSVTDVLIREDDHEILHVISAELSDDEVIGQIDHSRRFDFMQQHTGQHILTQAFVQTAEAITVGFHLGSNVTIDLDRANLQPEEVDRAEDRANQIVIENRPVTARIVDPEEANRLGTRIRRIPGHLATDGLRVIEVQDFDLTACGGTHVAHTGELGMIKVLKVENSKGGSRVEFAVGGRAFQDYRKRHTLISTLAGEFTVGMDDLENAVARLRTDVQTMQLELKKARADLLAFEVPALLAEAPETNGIRLISRIYEDRDVSEVRALASKLAEHEGVIAILGVPGEKAHVICARSKELTPDMNHVLRQALQSLGSDRGGGRPDFAQGGGVAASTDQMAATLDAASRTVMDG
jgi:alanyl-tRNA synthetase